MSHPLSVGALLAENSVFHTIGQIFQPIFKLFALALAYIYGLVPNYAIAVALLTVLIMAVLTPLTIKGTKSMIAMQALQPEIKKLRQKYKAPEDRELLNQEMMRLYREEGVSPTAGCLPVLLQAPFLFILYDIIRGLTNTVTRGAALTGGGHCHAALCAEPRYIPHSSLMYQHLVATPGVMNSFGVNLALKPFSHHSSVAAALPFFALVIVAVGLQYLQMHQMSKRNPAAAQASPQLANMQKYMPVLFGYFYFLVPAAAVIYMIVSSAIRFLTQDLIYRLGIVQPAKPGERKIPSDRGATQAPARPKGLMSRLMQAAENANTKAKADRQAIEARISVSKSANGSGNGAGKVPASGGGAPGRQRITNGNGAPAKTSPEGNGGVKNRVASNGNGSQVRPGASGTTSGSTRSPASANRSKDKRARKAR